MRTDVSVVLPVLDGEPYIGIFYRDLRRVLQRAPFSYELIFVENGSKDKSLMIVESLAKKDRHVRVVQSARGWGNAVRKGIQVARGTLCCYMVTDGQIDPKYIVEVYHALVRTGAAVAKIRRVTRENSQRLFMSRVYNLVARLLVGIKSQDINGTPKIFAHKRVRELHLESPNVAIDAELLLKIGHTGGIWTEIKAHSKQRAGGISTTNVLSVIEMVRSLWNFRKRFGPL